jgi:hypothetical protein
MAAAHAREEGCWEYMILPETWKTEVCKGIDPTRAVSALTQKGWLLGAKKGRPVDTVRLPGEPPMRLYRVSSCILGDDDTGAGGGIDAETQVQLAKCYP